MQESNNNSLSRQRSLNSDLINLRDDFDQFRITVNSKIFNSFNETISSRSSPKTFTNFPIKLYFKTKCNNLLINKNVDKDKNYNIKFKIEDNFPKTPNVVNNTFRAIQKNNNKNQKNLYKTALESIKKLNKSKTQIKFFSSDNSFKNIKNIFSGLKNIQNLQNISKTSYDNKFIRKKIGKENNINLSKIKNKSITNTNNIYFNSSLDNYYIKKKIQNKINRFNTISPLNKLNNTNFSFYSPKSYSVNFINKILNLYNKLNESKNDINKEKENDNNKKDINEVDDKEKIIIDDIDKETFNHISLKTLFQKNNAKIKSGILDEALIDKKIDNDVLLNPFTNSYGILLDRMSIKVGFMKGSMDIIYPKITQKKYQIRTLEKKERKIKRSSSQENIKDQNKDINRIFNIREKKKIIQSIFTKYPINIRNIGHNRLATKMYSFKGKKDLINKIANKTSNS